MKSANRLLNLAICWWFRLLARTVHVFPIAGARMADNATTGEKQGGADPASRPPSQRRSADVRASDACLRRGPTMPFLECFPTCEVTLKLEFPGGGENGADGSYEYKVKTFKLLEHSLEELEQKDLTLLTPLYALKYRKALKASKAGSEKRKALVSEVHQLALDMESAVTRAKASGIFTNDDAVETLRHIDTMCHELYDNYPEFMEVRMQLEERLKSHVAELRAEAEANGKTQLLNEVWRLHADGMTLEQALQHVQAEIGTPALAAPREAAR
jgi:hypothetical protein